MRIISASLLLVALVNLFSVNLASAQEIKSSNETKIQLKIDSWMLSYDPNNFKDSLDGQKINLKSEEDLKREKVLEKYAAKRKAADLPKGKFIINASAYTAAADECGKSDGITASGLKVKEKETIACPPQFPFGTKIKIEGMGTYICQDRGGAIKGNHIDIYMETKKQAFAFGRRNLTAEVIAETENLKAIVEAR